MKGYSKMRKQQKYGSIQTIVDGIKFPSILEATRYKQLKLLLADGQIKDLKLQVEFVINQAYRDAFTGEKMRAVVYIADFVYFDLRKKRNIVEDTKGVETPQFKNKWRQCREKYPEFEWCKLTRRDV